jgi:SpoVK/Ycf46/Vps4 family AAA+-type ATPase
MHGLRDGAGVGDTATQFGITNALRTGNVMLDMVICMMIPVAFKLLETIFTRFTPFINNILEKFKRSDRVCVKTLDFEFRTNSWGYEVKNGKEERNNILQKALTMFIGEIKTLKMNSSKLSFMAVQEKGSVGEDYEMEYGSTVEQLEQYRVSTLPQDNEWIDIRKGLRFCQSVLEPDSDEGGKSEGKIKKTTIRFEFEGENPGGSKLIDDFVDEAFQNYKNKMKALADHGRYLYICVKTPDSTSTSSEGEGGESAPSRVYKRYKLSDEKSFACLFFKEKRLLLKLMTHFMDKTGKYEIKGFPHKLGLLLHGPPGTGKTSLIKAMAQHTGRNVVSIPLARIETNQELMDIVFDQSFAVKGEDMPIKLSFKDVIFVMEDVDAASPIVHSRLENTEDQVTTPPVATGSSGDEGKDFMAAVLNSLTDTGTGDKKATVSNKYSSKYDKLDLAGLLNVLDGVVDCPNRILIMTTNHPEKLDAALIRPGRIDKIIYLGYIQYDAILEMLEHYFTEPLSPSQSDKLRKVMDNPPGVADMTPAEVEQLCAEYDTVDEFLRALEEKVAEDTAKFYAKNVPEEVHDLVPDLVRQSVSGNSTVDILPIDIQPMSRGLSALDEPH